MTQQQVIDVHTHVVPPALPERIRARAQSLPSVEVSETADGRPLIALPRSASLGAARPPIPGLLDLESGVSRMDQQGVDIAIISIWPDLLGTSLPPDESVAWAACVNDALIEVADNNDRLRALATIPLQSDRAVAEMERAKALGFVGIEIGTRALAYELDSERLEPFWAAAARLQLPVFVHPLYYGGDERLADQRAFGLANGIGRVNDTTIAISRVLLAGIPIRHSGLEIIVAHGGGAIPYLLGRLGNIHALNADTADPYAGFSRLHFDSILFDPQILAYLIAKAGNDHVMLGSDHPFPNGDSEPRAIVTNATEDAHARDLVLGGNACRIFGL
jgi:aminocarboxymuconate-semialdehyde decarboxylase